MVRGGKPKSNLNGLAGTPLSDGTSVFSLDGEALTREEFLDHLSDDFDFKEFKNLLGEKEYVKLKKVKRKHAIQKFLTHPGVRLFCFVLLFVLLAFRDHIFGYVQVVVVAVTSSPRLQRWFASWCKLWNQQTLAELEALERRRKLLEPAVNATKNFLYGVALTVGHSVGK